MAIRNLLIRGVLVLASFTTAFSVGVLTCGAANAPTVNTAGMLQPAVSAAASLRPVWDGHHPARWTGPDAMCPAGSDRLHRWARTAPGAPWFRVECLPDGPHEWAWNAITPKGR